jgi:type VII secretion integral membrane protein EccD
MTIAAAAPARPAVIGETETCRLTVAGPARRADLTVPANVTVAELLPLLLRHVAGDEDRGQPWVLQRLGEEPLDADSTAEMLDLRHGEVLYLRPGQHALPAMEFDDVAVGVARVIGGRSDRWQPAFTRRLLLGVAGLALAAFAAGALGLQPGWRVALCLGVAAVALAAGSVVASRVLDDGPIGLLAGLSGCVMAALAGLAARHGLAGVLGLGREDVLLAAASAGVLAAALVFAGRVPAGPYGAVLATAVAAAAASWGALALHASATRVVAVLAVVIFVTGVRSVRMVLRAARLRVPNLPRTAEELQEDIDPDPEDLVASRAGAAVAFLDGLTICAALVYAVAFVELVRTPEWIGLTLTAVLAVAALLRARAMVGLWQRTALAVSGCLGLALAIVVLASRAAPAPRVIALFALLAVAAGLLVAARRLAAARLLPVWGHAADLLEVWSALALVPLLLQLLHVYAYCRSLVG